MVDNRVDNPDKIANYSLQLPSQLESLTLVENLVDTINEQYDLADEVYANVLTCLNEAVSNAVVHGNKGDTAKFIFVDFLGEVNQLIFKVRDQGTGFNYKNLPDPTDPENLEKLTGRGIFIVRQLADKCLFNETGNEVELHFAI